MFFTQVLNGLQLGSIYALVALGYTMVYGIILLLNFAHGDIIMVGAYVSWLVMAQLGLHPVLAIILSVAACTLMGVLIDKVAYAPLRNAPRLSILITAIGVSYFLENGAHGLMGINVNTTISFTFAVGSALAGIGAVLYAMAYTQANPTMGMMLGTKAFVAAVLGGIGSIPGAVVGGLLVGFAEVIVTALNLSVWKDAVVFLLLIVVLVVRPTGIFGRTMNEKV